AGFNLFKTLFDIVGDQTNIFEVKLEPLKKAPQSDITQKLGIEMRRFEGGYRFMMGSQSNEKGRLRNEQLRHVELRKPFELSSHEITNQQYWAFKKPQQQDVSKAMLPVSNITWLEAALFCNWLSLQQGLEAFYQFENGVYKSFNSDATGYRLPSEAEWEWVARHGAHQNRKLTRFVWGDDIVLSKNVGNLAGVEARGKARYIIPNYDDGYANLAPVGQFVPNIFGIYDLAGNVSEWTHDLYDVGTSSNEVEIDPMGVLYPNVETAHKHVVKGSNFLSGHLRELRAAFRMSEDQANSMIGFRIARWYSID
ncbi:MAG: SUMF1/EgtB/PvdO family nonheme iron enzyme, partial [Pseudomonadota bacterium]